VGYIVWVDAFAMADTVAYSVPSTISNMSVSLFKAETSQYSTESVACIVMINPDFLRMVLSMHLSQTPNYQGMYSARSAKMEEQLVVVLHCQPNNAWVAI
jgi:hypothetical protein